MLPGEMKIGARAGRYSLVLIRRDYMTDEMVQVWQDGDACSEWRGSVPSEMDLDLKRGLFGNV